MTYSAAKVSIHTKALFDREEADRLVEALPFNFNQTDAKGIVRDLHRDDQVGEISELVKGGGLKRTAIQEVYLQSNLLLAAIEVQKAGHTDKLEAALDKLSAAILELI